MLPLARLSPLVVISFAVASFSSIALAQQPPPLPPPASQPPPAVVYQPAPTQPPPVSGPYAAPQGGQPQYVYGTQPVYVLPPPPQERPFRSVTIDINPLSFFIGRYGPNVQYLPVPHHAIIVNPFFVSVNAEVDTLETSNNGTTTRSYDQKFNGFGGEVGYRFYTARHGAAGFFVGPSLIAGAYTAKSSDTGSVSFNSIGYAIDFGGQAVLPGGFTIGGGFGWQYTKVSKDFNDLPLTAGVIAGGGFRPRFLFSVGYSF